MSDYLALAREAIEQLDNAEIMGSGSGSELHVVRHLPPFKKDWPEYWREAFEERVAIMIYDGELPEDEARLRAEGRVRIEYQRTRDTWVRSSPGNDNVINEGIE